MNNDHLLVRFNRRLMKTFISWAGLNGEFERATSRLHEVIDYGTMFWSAWIVITSSIKFSRASSRPDSDWPVGEPVCGSAHSLIGRDINQLEQLLLLDYLPLITNGFSCYYGLMILTVGYSLGWRVYLRVHAHSRKVSRAKEVDKLCQGNQKQITRESKLSLISWFIDGPGEDTEAKERLTQLIADRHFNKNCKWRLELANWGFNMGSGAFKSRLLSWQYEQHVAELENLELQIFYSNPMGHIDFLCTQTPAHWFYLVGRVYKFIGVALSLTIPIVYLSHVSMYRFIERFGIWPTAECGDPSEWLFDSSMIFYGLLEQVYAASQAITLAVVTNVFVALFHADLMHKAWVIIEQLRALRDNFNRDSIVSVPLREVYDCQLRIWSYFNYIERIDDFLSRYTATSLFQLAIGVTFGQIFISLDEPIFKQATVAVLSMFLISFAYIHLVAEQVERQSKQMQQLLFTNLALEPKISQKREWQRVMEGYFRKNQKRTFTFLGKFPTSVRTLVRTLIIIWAVSTLLKHVFRIQS